MTANDIFSEIINHQIEGLMIHDQLSDYYGFLGLPKYRKEHEKHYKKESKAYRRITDYAVDHFNKLPRMGQIPNPNVIPDSWHNVNRDAVDANTMRTAVKSGLETWIKWEKDTKAFYQNKYAELISINEIAAAMIVGELISDVDEELKTAEMYHLWKKHSDYDAVSITEEQYNGN